MALIISLQQLHSLLFLHFSSSGINQGEDLPEAMLTELYQNILETEIRLDGSGPFPNALKKGFYSYFYSYSPCSF